MYREGGGGGGEKERERENKMRESPASVKFLRHYILVWGDFKTIGYKTKKILGPLCIAYWVH